MSCPKVRKYIKYDARNEWINETGQYHRINAPAIEYADGTRVYFINGKRHRLDGPAVEYADGTHRYWVNRKHLTSLKSDKLIYLNELLT